MKKSLFLSLGLILAAAGAFADDGGLHFSTSGSDGWDGSDGRSGYGAGGDGTSGQDGRDAQPIDLTFQEIDGQLKIFGTAGSAVQQQIKNSYQIITLKALGGDGGRGGSGGYGQSGTDGVDGRDGYDGRRGEDGRRGRDGTRSSPDGENGSPGWNGSDGQDGTPGTDGTNGYPGGSGAWGGDGGKAGSITIRYTLPDTLMQIEASNEPGSGGDGGRGGAGGRGGIGGTGGRGGSGGPGGDGGRGGRGYNCSEEEKKHGCHDGRDGRDGPDGWRGRDGSHGRDGSSGYNGSSGRSGGNGSSGAAAPIRYVQVDASGHTISESSEVYHLSLVSFDLRDENGDGVFAPWEKIYISNAKVVNDSKMAMPAGARVVFSIDGSRQTVVVSNLPAIGAGQTLTLDEQVLPSLRVGNGDTLVVRSDVDFRTISFASYNASRQVAIRFPLQISQAQADPAISPVKSGVGKITVTNISTKSISASQAFYSATGPMKFVVTSDLGAVAPGQSVPVSVHYSVSGSTAEVQDAEMDIQLTVEGHASGLVRFPIRTVPDYQYKADSDVLVISDGMSEAGFAQIAESFKSLLLKHDFYDVDINGELSADLAKKYQNKMVFFVHARGGKGDLAKAAVTAFAQTSGGLILGNSVWSVAFPSYQDLAVVDSNDVFGFSSEGLRAWLDQSISKAMPFALKLGKIETYFMDSASLFSNVLKSMVSDVAREYGSSGADEIYTKQGAQSFAGKFTAYVTALDLFNDGALRAAMLGAVPSLEALRNSSNPKLSASYEKVIRPVHVAYLDMAAVAKNCGNISGQYANASRETLWIWKNSVESKSAKGQMTVQGKTSSLSAELAGTNLWNVSYGGRTIQAQIVCQPEQVQLIWKDGAKTTEFRKLNNRTKNLNDSSDTFEDCIASGSWITDRNSRCEADYWTGCGSSSGATKCMVKVK